MPLSRETKNFFGLVAFGATYGAALDYAHTHGGAIEYPEGTHHERGILTFAVAYSVVPLLVSLYRMKTESFIEIDPIRVNENTATEVGKEMVAAPLMASIAGGAAQTSSSSVAVDPMATPQASVSNNATVAAATDLLPSLTAAVEAAKAHPPKKIKRDTRWAKSLPPTGSIYALAVRSLRKSAYVAFTAEENKRRRFIRQHPLAPWEYAFPAMAVLYTAGYLLTAYGWNRMPSLAIAAVLATPTVYLWQKWDRSLHGLAVLIVSGVVGASTEAFLNTHLESMTYQTNDIFGIPYWLYWIYALNYTTYGHLTRFLLEPKHTVKVFVGVESLPHRWARAFYRNHLGLAKGTPVEHE